VSGRSATPNKFCRSTDLANEASVESFFVLRLLADLGYEDREVHTKRSIQELRIAKGRRREPYKPDFMLFCTGRPRWLLDAKAPDQRIDEYTYQCAGYALLVNRKYAERPCKYYVLSNGLLTRVYVWDQEQPVLSLRFADFMDSNTKYQALRRLLSAGAARKGWPNGAAARVGHLLQRPTMDAVKRAFLRCHRIIWKSEKMSPQAAFVAFAKLLFVKLWEDRRLRDEPAYVAAIAQAEPLPAEAVRYSMRWVQQQEKDDPNPVDTILFRHLVEQLEHEIKQRRRKRIFEPDERLGLSPGTVKRVVEQLEDYYLFGIDEDLNGRMFEAFLAATMRGQALGQYFTPRSIVKLMTRLAEPKAGRAEIERVLDACCGTGGFLIEALTEMRQQIYDNTSLTLRERNALLDEVANQAIFGIDAGREPPIARIARINMYLHGDGGSRVYMTDSLQHPPKPSQADSVEVKEEVEELRKLVEEGVLFDVVLTNPPFSMDYAASVPEEKEILETYDLATQGGARHGSLRSSVMFVERYWNVLRPGGRLLTVIDDSVLSAKKYAFVRDFIRERFIIRGVISLHGDAFQRAGARAKTSVLFLTKRTPVVTEAQPAVFVYESRYIGLDDVVPKTPASVAEVARTRAADEIAGIIAAFKSYMGGDRGPWLVPAERVVGRLDAKYLRPWSVGELEPKWKAAGVASEILDDLVLLVEDVVKLEPNTSYTFLRVSYDGYAERGEERLGREVSYARVIRAKSDDIVVSNINAVNGAICVIPKEFEDVLISNEFTVLRLKPGVKADPLYLWSVLRSTAVRAQWISGSSGVGRHRVDWDLLRQQRVPLFTPERQREIGDLYRAVQEREKQIAGYRDAASRALASLDLEGETAHDRLVRAKPPR